MDESALQPPLSKERYLVDQLNPADGADIFHFEPTANGRDEFGNRVFSSPLSYLDRENRITKAALLVTPKGEQFIKSNKGILQDIDAGIKKFTDKIKSEKIDLLDEENPVFTISPTKNLTWIHSGGQSNAFILEVDDKKYIVKTITSMSTQYEDFSQPYINEMLQVQHMGKALKEDFQKANIQMPEFLFATGYLSCTEFVDGQPTIQPADPQPILDAIKKADEYVEKMKKNKNSLWHDIHVDWNGVAIPSKNMIRTKDTFVWVDPFYHNITD